MTDLSPLCALGAATPRRLDLGFARLEECPDVALASLAYASGFAPVGLPGAGHWAALDGCTALWTGPDQWMVEGPGQAETDFAASLAARMPGARVTEQTDGWVLLTLTGAVARVLERTVNLGPEALAPGRGTRSAIEHMAVLLIRRDADTLAIWGMRSAADSLWHALETVLRRLG